MAKFKLFKGNETETPSDEHKAMLETVKNIFTDTKQEREKMNRALKLFEGKLWNYDDQEFELKERPHGRSYVQYNTIFATIQAVAPMVTDSRPITKVVPRFPWLEKMGIALNHAIKYSWEAFDMQMILYRAVMDSMIFGQAIFKVWYNQDKPWGGDVEVSLIDPRDFFIAPGYETIWEAPFCGVRSKKPLSWIRRNFPHVKEVKGATSEMDGDDAEKAYKFGRTRSVSEETTFVTLYEVWVRDEETMEQIVEASDESGEEETVERQKYPYGKVHYFTEHQDFGAIACTDDHGLPPYVEMWDYIRPHNFLGMSEVEQIEGIHKEMNTLLKYISEYVRKNHAPNFLVDIFQLQDEGYEQLKSRLSEGNQYIPWDSAGGAKDPPIQQINDGQLNPQILNMLSYFGEIIDVVSGVTDITRGQVGKQERQSASEVAMLMESSNTRTRQRVRNLEWALKRLYYLILRNIMQYYDQPRDLSYAENGGRNYFTYGNSKAQAEEIMQPTPMSEDAQIAMQQGIPQEPGSKNQQEIERYKAEYEDYQKFLEYFSEEGEYDPIFFDFDIEIQTDSTLPTDKQARANLFLRLRQLKAMDTLSLLERLQVPNADEIMNRIKEESGQGEQMKKMMAAMKQAQAKGGQPQGRPA